MHKEMKRHYMQLDCFIDVYGYNVLP